MKRSEAVEILGYAADESVIGNVLVVTSEKGLVGSFVDEPFTVGVDHDRVEIHVSGANLALHGILRRHGERCKIDVVR